MEVSFTKKTIIILIIGVALTVTLVIGSYFSIIQPKQEMRANAESQLENEQKILELLEKNQHAKEERIIEQTTEMQQKLPIAPLIDQLLLDFQRVEALSDTYILQIDIDQNSDATPPDQEESEDVAEGDEEDQDSIEGLKQITVYLSILAKTYEDLSRFLTEMDRLSRIISIDSISFRGNDERIMIDDYHENLEFGVTVSTYYFPELTGLEDELPKVIHPSPSGKINPLYNQ